MDLLACVFVVSLPCSEKPPAAWLCLRYLSCLYQVVPRWLGEEWAGGRQVRVCGSVLSYGFNYDEYRLECSFCPFTICQVRVVMPDKLQEWGAEGDSHSGDSGLSTLHLLYGFSAPDPGLSLSMHQPLRLD